MTSPNGGIYCIFPIANRIDLLQSIYCSSSSIDIILCCFNSLFIKALNHSNNFWSVLFCVLKICVYERN